MKDQEVIFDTPFEVKAGDGYVIDHDATRGWYIRPPRQGEKPMREALTDMRITGIRIMMS